MENLEIHISDDPEVVEYIRFTYSRIGILHAKALDGDGPKEDILKNPPGLSDEQLLEVDSIVERLEAVKKHLNWETINDWICKKMWIIAGEYCGGTKFATGFLQKLGITAGHETLFSIEGHIGGLGMVACRNSVEVSGGAPIWLPCFPDVRVMWLVRHPVDTLNSQYHFKNRTDDKTMDLQRDMLARWTMIIAARPAMCWRVESLPDQLKALDCMGLSPERLKPGALEGARKAPRNSKKRKNDHVPITWDRLIPPLREIATDLGYNEKGLKE